MSDVIESDYQRMGKEWLGLGNLNAKCWFIGMEPGGDAACDVAWSAEWAHKFGAAQTVDLHECATPKEEPYIRAENNLHRTWSPLIRCRLSYEAQPTDDAEVLRYQREHFARSNGRDAFLELSAYASKNMSLPSPREKYRNDRIALLAKTIDYHHPEIVVFYSRTYIAYYEMIAGGPFDDDGFRWFGDTLCAVTLHPFQQYGKSPPPEFWIDLGREMRRRVHERKNAAARP